MAEVQNIRITKKFTFEMAHALDGYDGLCSQIHGHSYKLWVTVIGKPSCEVSDPKLGMVMDFGELKKTVARLIIDRLDHSFAVLDNSDSPEYVKCLAKNFERIVMLPFQPTCENMVAWFAELLIPELPSTVSLCTLRLYETESSFAEWHATDN